MSAQTLLCLEERVSLLEKEVFGEQTGATNEITIAEMLLNAHTMMTSALTCRDNIAKVLDRLPQLNVFLNPLEHDNHLEIEAKKEYIVLLYSEMKCLGQMVKEFSRLQKFLNSEAIANASGIDQKLQQILGSNVDSYLDSTQATKEVHSTISNYNGILSSLEVLFMKFDQSLNEIETARNPTKKRFID